MNRGRIRISLAAIAANYQLFCSVADGRVGAVVKSNAYGLGARTIVKRLLEQGCRDFFVETLEEASALGDLAMENCYVFAGPNDVDALDTMSSLGVTPVVNCPRQLALVRKHGTNEIAIQVDTGMHRMGFTPEEYRSTNFSGLSVRLLMTHLACADTPEHPLNAHQIGVFGELRKRLPGVPTSIGNSAGSLNGPAYQGDLARPGIGLYGGNPYRDRLNPMNCAFTLEGRVLRIRTVKAGEAIGYGATVVTDRPTNVAIIGVGYADGISRRYSSEGAVVFEGEALSLLGLVSMDMMQVNAVCAPKLRVGDWVEIAGTSQTLESVARKMGRTSYEFLTGLAPRLQRLYAE